MTSNPAFRRSFETNFFIELLEKIPVGSELRYDEMSKALGQPVSGSTSSLYSARQSLLKEKNVVFDVIPGVGIKRLNDIEIVDTSSRTARRIRATAKRGVRTLTAIADFSGLPREKQMRHSASVSILAVVSEMTSTSGIKKIEASANISRGRLPISETIEAFK